MRKFTNELMIGIFVVLAIGVGVLFWIKTENFTADETYNLKTYFTYAGNVKENAVVSLSGIEVGRVEKIAFKYDTGTKVEVVLSLSRNAKVRTDSIAYIGTAGFIGDAFVGLTPGTPGTAFAKAGAVIQSEDPIQMRELMKKADSISKKIDETLVDVKALASNLNGTLQDNRGRIDSIMVNLEQTSVNFNEFSEDIKQHPWKLLMKGKDTKKKK